MSPRPSAAEARGLGVGYQRETVVVSFRTVGTLLVFGMLLAPAASAALFSRKVATMILGAIALGTASVYAGLLASYHFDLAAGAAVTLAASAIFFILLGARQLLPGPDPRRAARGARP